MNAPLVTRAAEGFDRRAFTVEELWAMQRAGLFDEDAPFELWEGELVAMSPKHNRHELWKRNLVRIVVRALPDEIVLAVEPSFYLSDTTFLEPDLLIHADALLPEDVRGPDVLLAIEVADSSIARDLQPKARLYAKHGVRHYWVLDAENRRAFIHTSPGAERYGEVVEVGSNAVLTLPFEPALKIALADLG
jgi:Uma2 family endonuclease